MRKIALLGSTGSIGTQALDVAARHADRFQIVALTANTNAEKLFAQARQFHPHMCGLVHGYAAVFFENGKGVRIPVSMYETKTNRKKLTNAYSDASAPVGIVFTDTAESEILLVSNQNKALVISSALVPEKATRTSQGVQLMTLKKGGKLIFASADVISSLTDAKKFRKNKLPASGTALSDEEAAALGL